jgi:hypothetical protein
MEGLNAMTVFGGADLLTSSESGWRRRGKNMDDCFDREQVKWHVCGFMGNWVTRSLGESRELADVWTLYIFVHQANPRAIKRLCSRA